MDAVEQPGTPLVIEHEERTVDQGQTPEPSGLSELEQYKKDRDAGKVQPEPSAEKPEKSGDKPEKPSEKPDKWADPDTGETYDMRHKVARRIKTVLEDRGRERSRAEAAERRVDELTRMLIERGATPAQAEKQATQAVSGDPEPDPGDVQKYPEGQFDRAFIRDQARWAARQETQQFAQASRAEQQQAAQQAREMAELGAWQQTLPEARKRYADFDEVLARIPNSAETAPIVQLMMRSPVGNDVVYVLGTQPEAMEAYRRAPNAESRQRLLYHIEAQVIQHQRGQQTRPAATTKAPAPTNPVQPGAAAQSVDWSRTDDPDQYARWKAQRSNRR